MTAPQPPATTPRKPPLRKTPEPADKDSFGHALWLALGGSSADVTECAAALDLTVPHLWRVLHGRRNITRRRIAKDRWRDRLAAIDPAAWKTHRPAFEAACLRLPLRHRMVAAAPEPAEAWRLAGQTILNRLLHDTGDSIDELMHAAKGKVFRRRTPWKYLAAADARLTTPRFAEALMELSTIYNLPERDPRLHRKIAKLIRQPK